MERESWKNVGLAGAAVVALGCGGMWFFSGPEAVQTTTAPSARPVKVVTAMPAAPVKPKPTMTVADATKPRPVPPPRPPDANGERKKHLAGNPKVVKKKQLTAG